MYMYLSSLGLTLAIALIYGSTTSASDKGWQLGMYDTEAYDDAGELLKAPQASQTEASGKGAPLLIKQCRGGDQLQMVDGPEDGFWKSKPIGEDQAWQIYWLDAERKKPRAPILAEPGMYGYYFTLSAERIAGTQRMGLCPGADAKPSSCRWFDTVDLGKAISYVCGRGTVETLAAFYGALARADAEAALKFVSPELGKQNSFFASYIESYYSKLDRPFRLQSIEYITDEKARAKYNYVREGRACSGEAIVRLGRRNSLPIIEGVELLNGC